ncbi:MAG: bifunctional folylpolyglutamate synthase/dihydrofolate synthase [Candidatus Cloacimonetes bacterium]|nr:bifunctional folylpolyglutamate synthase/dihydrofolate synthase [Candidatus Cloacimonadota bacterium]MDD2229352.1 bifunctional folylpolyglutamate synthase/dihydrofolate synthase [Candidatus Cloacimonadota bacterium]
MLYKEFLNHIYKKYSGNVKLELSRMTGLLADMGSPEKDLNGFHVAGTNGKGSVCAALEALCLAHGLSTALNTSPHLISYTERFRIDGEELPFETILNAFHKYETLFEKWDASFFEITTAIAFGIFAERKTQVAVIEVGLGGRLDATNLFNPNVEVITNIGLDHVKTLGGTLEIIAGEKAGIIKPGIPLVLGNIEESPRSIIETVALAYKAPVYRYNQEWNAEVNSDQLDGLNFDYSYEGYSFRSLRANLIGEHQAINLSTALTAFILYAKSKGLKVQEEFVRKALQSINWQGRMQVLSTSPVLIIDGAHNVHGVTALMKTLATMFPKRKLKFIISILGDKDYSEMIHLFCSHADVLYIAQNQSDRAATVEAQVAAVKKYAVPYKTSVSVAEALKLALSECKPDDVLVAGGSLYTVGEVLQAYEHRA